MESTVQILPTAITYFSVQVSAKWSKFPRKQEARAPVKSILARHHQESMFSTHQRHIPSPWHIGKSKLDKASLTCIWARISSAGSTIIRSYTINITVLSRSEQGTQKHLHEGTWLFSQPFFPCCDGSAGCSQCWHISMIISSWKSKHFWAPHQNIWWFKKKKNSEVFNSLVHFGCGEPNLEICALNLGSPCRENGMGWTLPRECPSQEAAPF